MTDPTPPRVRVTRPPTGRPRATTVAAEIDAGSSVGEVYVQSLIRAQLRLALGIVAALVIGIGALPILFASVPVTRRIEVAGIPLPWLVLGVLVYPVLWLLGAVYTRRAERNEAVFDDLVEHDRR